VAIRPLGPPIPPAGQKCNSDGGPYPTMVLEVGFSETTPSLQDLANSYFSHGQPSKFTWRSSYFLGIRIVQWQCLHCFIYVQILCHVISFGTTPLHHLTVSALLDAVVPNIFTGLGYPPATQLVLKIINSTSLLLRSSQWCSCWCRSFVPFRFVGSAK